jgi:peroxiredoxin
MRCATAAAFALLAAVPLAAADPAPKRLAPGDVAPVWKDLPGTDGKKHSLADFKDKEVVVVVFTSNSCPVAEDYEDRIIAFAKAHAGADTKVALVAINSNTIPEDRLDQMKTRAEKKGFPFAYLADDTQQTARDYGAEYTPEVFVLGKDRKVVYRGAFDDASNPEKVKVRYAEKAVQAALAGEKMEPAETVAAAGCKIRFRRKQ